MTEMSAASITARLRRAASLSDLVTERRLVPKLDMSTRGITARLRQVESLRRMCQRLVGLGARASEHR